MSSRLRIIVCGLIAEYPLGGMTWHYLHYVLGLARLGHDVYYIEHSGSWPYSPVERAVVGRCDYNVDYLARTMSRFGLADRWAYFFEVESRWFGMSDEKRKKVIRSADLLINVSGALDRPEDYRSAECLTYVDTDPVFAQLKLLRGEAGFVRRVNVHDVHFSFGELVSQSIPDTGHIWLPTRQPVVVGEWETSDPPSRGFTTVMNWTSYKSELWHGRTYGQKDVEFLRFIHLPGLVPEARLEIAGAPGTSHPIPRKALTDKGWHVVEPSSVCPDLDSYRHYIRSSKAEWSVAKNAYVQGGSGWFSERSACYLASGRPVIVQETGFSQLLPVGEGIVPFTSLDEAVMAIREVEGNYLRHSSAARAISKAYFDSDQVLNSLLERAMARATPKLC
jgi:hypothetical protein